jgi:UDP-N-acetyl-D-glucosamine dehydrogenase
MTTHTFIETSLSRIAARDYTVTIVGMGYVGLPLALAALDAGFRVIGLDIDADRVRLLNAGRGGFAHVSDAPLAEAVAAGRFEATSDGAALADADAILIAVPTPLNRHREPDLRFVIASAEMIADNLRPGQLVVLESTTWPGTTREVVRPILERSGLTVGEDVFLAFSPEREDPGNRAFNTASIPKVVGAATEACGEVARALYGALVAEVVPVPDLDTAEAVKITENVYRSVNIALVNELKTVYDAMGIDVWDVIEAAATKPFGFTPFYPGPGLGGHCIPIDPFYLTWRARSFDVQTKFIELAGEVNTAMPGYVIARLREAMDRRTGRGLNGARVLVVGLAYKKNIEDTRESPSLRLLAMLGEAGADVAFHDPFVARVPKTRNYAALAGQASVELGSETLAGFDAVLIATDHDNIDWHGIAAHARLVVDTRNVMARNGLAGDHIVKA